MCHLSPCFSVLPMLLLWHYKTHWPSDTAPVLLRGCYATLTSWSTASATDLKECFLLSGVFHLALLPGFFKPSLRVGSSTSKLAGLHADIRNIAPIQLFVWIITIRKRFICGKFYLMARACQSQNISLHEEVVLQNIRLHGELVLWNNSLTVCLFHHRGTLNTGFFRDLNSLHSRGVCY